ncbi:MAG: NAD(P)-dependent alcohol dehydrogenase [Opitutales bacterium]|nr:NAD(P)-dependent alcohol dehydrogenase [Opitutales bacterium]
MIKAYMANAQGAPFQRAEYDPGPLGAEEVEIHVAFCGLCHSDLSIWKNEWGMSTYPLVPGHEVVGTIAATGEAVRHLSPGQKVGLGWFSGSCLTCPDCMSGDHNLCAEVDQTIIGRHGGFADRVRTKAEWAIPLPENLDFAKAGPLFCGGITVFNPLVINQVKPTDRVGVVGIGGLGHLALQFARAWGCEVTAFSSSPDKEAEARKLGAHRFVASRDPEEIKKVANSLDLILVTINTPLDWEPFLNALRAKGKLHFVGALPELSSPFFPLLSGQKSMGASPLGSPATTARMLEFCARHNIAPVVEEMKMSQINEAFERLEKGEPRYRIVLKNDFEE